MLPRWTDTVVGGHPCDIFEPDEPHPRGHTVIYLHGVHLNRLVDNQTFTDQFIRHRLRVVAPMTQRSWWTDRVCREFDESITAEQHVLQRVLPYIEERWGVAPKRIGLLGTSMGGQGALRFAYKHPQLFPVVAAVSPAIDYQQRIVDGDETLADMYSDHEAARQDTALLHIHPLNWPQHQFFCCDPADERWWDSSDRLHMKLYSLGVPHECDLETSGGGHGFDYYNCMAERAVQFLGEKIDEADRSLL
ncbi:MAG: alpha/beta hydrolase-fold protein [Pirellulaceae bacterium]|jgi:pimeloyl-ACP methyl ester carboxylesterase|nr:alpha/beta hydrolase-fold protein [Pirellulaceae bacterium]MDP7015312.1 alpha/beta hydrolase-fold protein [Pirellulaceae bacterium]